MTAIQLDTVKLADCLESGGSTPQQAKAVAGALADSLGDARLVTEPSLGQRLAELRTVPLKWMFGMLLGQTAILAALVKLP